MLQDLREEQRPERQIATLSETRDVSRAAVLSTIVALALVVTAVLSWNADAAAHRPFGLLDVVRHCMPVGVVALLVATLIEQWFKR